jgi:hypothetical protein
MPPRKTMMRTFSLLLLLSPEITRAFIPRVTHTSRCTTEFSHYQSSVYASKLSKRDHRMKNVKMSLRSDKDDYATPFEPTLSKRRVGYAFLWTGLLVYASYFSSTVSLESAALAPEILNKAIFSPFDGTLSPVFVSLFNFLGILPCVYAGLLLPSANRQKIWALPFVLSSFALGFFGLGPYLCIRERSRPLFEKVGHSESVSLNMLSLADRARGSILFETRFTAILLLFGTLYLFYYALFGSYQGIDRWSAFLELFNTQPIARISTIDFIILSTVVSFSPHTFIIHSFIHSFFVIFNISFNLNSLRCTIR